MAHFEITAPDRQRWTEELREQESLTIGRHSSNTIAMDDDQVPTLLARVLWNKKSRGFEITAATEQDLQLSGKLVRNATLQPGDELLIAGYQIVYRDETYASTKLAHSGDRDAESAPEAATKENKPANVTDEPVDFDTPSRSKKKKRRRKKSRKSADGKLELSKSTDEEEEESLGEWLTRKRRPGERDALRSPLVTSLAFLGIVLVVAAAAVYLLIGRDAAQAQLKAARADREAGKYGQAFTRYEQFLDDFPYSKYAHEALRELGFTRIELALTGAASDLTEATKAIEEFVDQFRQDDDFRDTYPDLARYASRIAQEAYSEASRRHDPDYLTVGDTALSLFERFNSSEPDDPRRLELNQAAQSARADLLEFDVRKTALAEMDQSLQAKEVSATLETFRVAIARYPNFAEDEAFVERIQQALAQEQEFITAEVSPSQPDEPKPPVKPADQYETTTLIDHRQTRFDLQSDGRTVWLETAGQLYGIDRMTGKPVWKQNIGRANPFPPVDATTIEPAWLLAVNGGTQLRLIERDSGRTIWETPLPSPVRVKPLIIGALAYLPAGDQLFSIDLETGQLLGRMQFPRPLTAPLAALDDRRLIAIAQEDVFYELDRMNWSCEAVRYYGHAPGTIQVQPFLLDKSLLLVESDTLTAGRLQVLDRRDVHWQVRVLQSERLPGIAVGQPVYWGDRLFLETYGPRIAVWQLSDRPDQPPLERLTVAPLPFDEDTRVHILPVEGDRLLIAGESLRELTLLTNTFEQNDLGIQLGRTTQPLQQAGTHVFLSGRNQPVNGTAFFDFDYETQNSSWSLQLATAPRALLIAPQGAADTPEATSRLTAINARAQRFTFSTAAAENTDNPDDSGVEPSFRWQEVRDVVFEQGNASSRIEPIYLARGQGQQAVLLHSGNQLKLLKPNGDTERTLTLSGKPNAAGAFNQQTFLWGNNIGVHWTSLTNDISTEPWNLPLEQEDNNAKQAGKATTVDWTDLVLVDEQSALALLDGEKIIAMKHRTDPKPHLAETGSFLFPEPILGPGVLHDNRYTVALTSGELLSIDARSLLVREQTKLSEPAVNGPWLTGNQLLVEIASHELIAYSTENQKDPLWTLSLDSARLADQPYEVSNDQTILSLSDGRHLLINNNEGKVLQSWAMSAPSSCQPLITPTAFIFGLKNGEIVQIKRTNNANQP